MEMNVCVAKQYKMFQCTSVVKYNYSIDQHHIWCCVVSENRKISLATEFLFDFVASTKTPISLHHNQLFKGKHSACMCCMIETLTTLQHSTFHVCLKRKIAKSLLRHNSYLILSQAMKCQFLCTTNNHSKEHTLLECAI